MAAPSRSSMTFLHRSALWASLALLIAAIALLSIDRAQIGGSVLTVFFAVAAFGARGNEKLRGISFSLLIFAAVSSTLPLLRITKRIWLSSPELIS